MRTVEIIRRATVPALLVMLPYQLPAGESPTVGKDVDAVHEPPPEYKDLLRPQTGGTTVEGARIAGERQDEPGEWLMPRKDHALSGYSELDEITTENVKDLKVAWTFSTGETRGHEAAPLVVDGVMYLVTPFPNRVFALDIAKQGEKIWSYNPHPDSAAQGVACCDVVNRGITYDDGRLFFNTLDNRTIALDAETGEELWRVKLGDINKGETMTMAPLVVKDKVLVGNSGGEFGVRGWLTALNAESGDIEWRAWSTGPDRDVLIDQSNFNPPYEADEGKDLGKTTWPSDFWKIGGGTVWAWISYDRERDLIYYGTGNPGSWNPALRPGDNKWATSLFARDPDDGKARWAYQTTPHDSWDFDNTNEFILVDLPMNGELREVMVHFSRNGFAYTHDRETGKVLVAEPFMPLNWSKGIDLETGQPIVNPHKVPGTGRWTRAICPAYVGGKDWQPAAFSPQTGNFYVPTNNVCSNVKGAETGYVSGVPFIEAEVVVLPGPGGYRGEFIAWDATSGKRVWSIKEDFPVWSGALATAGDVIFYGTMDRWFKAVDARSGEELWKFRMPSGVIGQPIAFEGPDGRQYIAVYSGIGGSAGFVAVQQVSLEDPTAAGGFAKALHDLQQATNRGGTLFVFGL